MLTLYKLFFLYMDKDNQRLTTVIKINTFQFRLNKSITKSKMKLN